MDRTLGEGGGEELDEGVGGRKEEGEWKSV